MKIINIIWGFALGAGIDKCFLTYDSLGTENNTVNVVSVCINIENLNSHIQPLIDRNVKLINIKSKLDFSWIWKLIHIIKTESPDLLFAHGFNGAILAAMIKLIGDIKVPFVCTYHGPYHAPSKKKKFLEPIFNGLSISIYKHLSKHTICVENFSKKYLIKKGVKRVSTVHNGIPDIEYHNKERNNEESIRLVTASRITEVKGLTYLLKALAILKERNVKFHYDMIGEGPLLESLIEEAKLLNLTESEISFQGFKDNIPDWLERSDIFILPSLFEYHSIAILEAMRSGCTIIATNVGGNCESLTHNKDAIIVEPKDPKSLADSIQYLIENPEVRDKLSKNARARFEREFTESAMKQGIIKILKS